MAASARIYSSRMPHFFDRILAYTRFVKELRRKICLWGYYIHTPPHYCFIPLSCVRFVKETRRKISRAGKLFPHTPTLLLYPSFMHSFCQGNAPKNFAGGGIIPPHPQAVARCYKHAVVRDIRQLPAARSGPAKFFAPLTTTENYIINARAERFPAPRLNCLTLRRNCTRSECSSFSKTLSQTFRPRVILISPSFPSGFPPPCPIRVQSS